METEELVFKVIEISDFMSVAVVGFGCGLVLGMLALAIASGYSILKSATMV